MCGHTQTLQQLTTGAALTLKDCLAPRLEYSVDALVSGLSIDSLSLIYWPAVACDVTFMLLPITTGCLPFSFFVT